MARRGALRVPRPSDPRDPWADAPVGELNEPLLPRWFILLSVLAVVAFLATAVAAFGLFGPEEVPVAERRPPPGEELTHDVGDHVVGDLPAEPYQAPCAALAGVAVGGTASDQALLRSALAGLCNTPLPEDAEAALAAFAGADGVVRFALFESTGVDSAADPTATPPRILVNARFEQMGRPRWIAPVIAHDAVVLAGDPAAATTALRAREVEAQVCRALLGTEEPSRGCQDAEGLLALPDPLAALRDAGYR